MAALPKIPVTNGDRLSELADQLVAVQRKINIIHEQNDEFFTKLKELEDERDGLQDKLKIEARKKSTVGDTRVLIERPELFVSVVGRSPSRSFDLDKAERFWAPGVLDVVVVKSIDSKMVDKLVEAGKLRDEQVRKAVVYGDPPTPAVTVRLT